MAWSSQNLCGLGGCCHGISFCFKSENRKAVAGSFALVCIQIIAMFFALKNERKPGAQFDKDSAGECGMLLWAAGNSSPAQMMDVVGLCKGSQMLVALGFSF